MAAVCHDIRAAPNSRITRCATLEHALTAELIHAAACDVQRALIFLALFENAGCGAKCTSLQGADIPILSIHPTGPHLAAFILP